MRRSDDEDYDDYARRTMCLNFARGCCRHRGRHWHSGCRFSHTIVDTTRLVRLAQHAFIGVTSNQARLVLEYSIISSDTSRNTRNEGWAVSIYGGQRPFKRQGHNAVEAAKAVEGHVYGKPLPEVRGASSTICKKHLEHRCLDGSTCRYRHDLFDTKRVEAFAKRLFQASGNNSDVRITYICSGKQWVVAFELLQGSSYATQVVADAHLGTAMTVAEQRLSDTPVIDFRPVPGQRDSNTSLTTPAPGSDNPPSYAAATSAQLPSYRSVVDATFTSSTIPPPAPHLTSSVQSSHRHSSVRSAYVSVAPSSYMSLSATTPALSNHHGTRPTGYSAMSSERRPLLAPSPGAYINTYNAINNPTRMHIPQSSSSRQALPSPVTSLCPRSEDSQGTPLVLQFMALVMIAAISWVFIVVITLPCTETTC
ncbi:hypothetical protein BC835DRAFT_1409787 [Cytidiella melzeri]|nr:hypothetical protein BC835DRAFT_1409787 [Cytidiella melzeri]